MAVLAKRPGDSFPMTLELNSRVRAGDELLLDRRGIQRRSRGTSTSTGPMSVSTTPDCVHDQQHRKNLVVAASSIGAIPFGLGARKCIGVRGGHRVTTRAVTTVRSTQRQYSPEMSAMLKSFPPRGPERRWKATEQSREQVVEQMLAPPFVLESSASQARRKTGLTKILAWLEQYPGQTWQDRWTASGADEVGNIAWRRLATRWLQSTGWSYQEPKKDFDALGSGMLPLMSGDVIRPSLSWLLTPGTVQILTAEMARSRDPRGFTALAALCREDPANSHTKDGALRRIATMMAAKGGMVSDITAGDCLELAALLPSIGGRSTDTSVYFYQLLHAMGVFPAAALPTVRIFNPKNQGQISVEQMIDRYDIACRPMRDLLVDYLRERRPSLDYTSLRAVAFGLSKLFWKDLENHHSGIDSLRLTPVVADAWKQRIALKKTRSETAGGQIVETDTPRADRGINYVAMVRAFYLDLAQWATDDPARWGIWAAPCPIREEEMSRRKGTLRPQVPHGSADPRTASCSAGPRGGGRHRAQAGSRTAEGGPGHHSGVRLHRSRSDLAPAGHQRSGRQGLG
ncbi:hypothetical protein AB0451_37540 [Streptomyces sp. NPDC052000]|uniref:hypothetical protein n=1 Tax=Streptomyces sp. NPDC052000 TaxID=3155676 RepID=UPI00344BFECB